MHKTHITAIFIFFIFAFSNAQTYNNLEEAIKDRNNVKILNLSNQGHSDLSMELTRFSNLEG